MCSGTVVASGREPFKSANYSAEKSPAPTRVSNKRKSLKKLRSLNRKLNQTVQSLGCGGSTDVGSNGTRSAPSLICLHSWDEDWESAYDR